VTVVSRWIFDGAFASSPQSGLAWFCFLFLLTESDMQISRIRLSEKVHAFAQSLVMLVTAVLADDDDNQNVQLCVSSSHHQ
jgi:hypothetical protein